MSSSGRLPRRGERGHRCQHFGADAQPALQHVPSTRVWFEGFPDELHSLRTERENLPDEVQPGITYENVTVRWRARARAVEQAYLDIEEGEVEEEEEESDE